MTLLIVACQTLESSAGSPLGPVPPGVHDGDPSPLTPEQGRRPWA